MCILSWSRRWLDLSEFIIEEYNNNHYRQNNIFCLTKDKRGML